MRIAIFGANGFIGRRLVPMANKEGHEVLPFDLPHNDIRKKAAFASKLKQFNPNTVINLAALLGTRISLPYSVSGMFETNVAGNLNVFEAAKEAGAKNFIFASSITVHGNNDLGKHQTPSSLFNPEHPYSASKAAAEFSLMQYAKTDPSMRIIALRPTMVIGEDSPIPHAPIDFVKTVLSGKDIELFGEGTHEREWIDVKDAANGIMKSVLHADEMTSGYHAFFLTGNRISMKALAEKVVQKLGGGVRHVPKTIQAFTLTSDPAESKRLLGWEAEISIDRMIEELARAFRGK